MPKSGDNRELVWLSGEVKSPPFSKRARIETGYLLRKLQEGELIAMPFSRPMPSIGKMCHELRVVDQNATWRIIYRIDADAIVILEVFQKKSRETPKHIIETCQRRLRFFDSL